VLYNNFFQNVGKEYYKNKRKFLFFFRVCININDQNNALLLYYDKIMNIHSRAPWPCQNIHALFHDSFHSSLLC